MEACEAMVADTSRVGSKGHCEVAFCSCAAFRGSKSVAEFKDVGKVLDQLVSVKWPRPTKYR